MTHDDPDRPTTGGRPSWRDAPNFALPSLMLTPRGGGLWQIQFMFPTKDRRGSFSWLARNMEQGVELDGFLTSWWEDPEQALREYFHEEPPKGKIWAFAPRQEIDGEPNIIDASEIEGLDL